MGDDSGMRITFTADSAIQIGCNVALQEVSQTCLACIAVSSRSARHSHGCITATTSL